MKTRKLMVMASAVGLIFTAGTTLATTGIWPSTTSDNWSTATWSGGMPTAAGDTANLTFNLTAACNVTIDTTSRTVGTLAIGDPTTAFFAYTLQASGGATLTFDNNGSGAALDKTSTATATDVISAPVILNDNLTITMAQPLTISGSISETGGARSLTKAGAGTLTLGGNNSYSGGTVVNAGTLNVSANNNLGANGSAITFNGSGGLTLTAAMTSDHPIALNNNANMSLKNTTGSSAISGDITGNGGILFVAGGSDLTLSSTNNTFTGALIAPSSPNNNDHFNFNSIGDAPGAGVISFSRTSYQTHIAYSGSTDLTLNYRQIEIKGANVDGMGSPVNQLRVIGSGSLTIMQDLLPAGTAGAKLLGLSGTGAGYFKGRIVDGAGLVVSITKLDNGTWTLSGTNTYSGVTKLSAGTLVANATSALGSSTVTVSGGTLVISASGAMTNSASLYLPRATTRNITLNADLNVARLFIDGVEYPAGTYTAAGVGSAWMNAGSGILTVGSTALQPLYWDLNGTTSGAGSTTPTGNWDGSNTYWNNASDGTDSTDAWTAGRTAAFAAGTAATGTYTVTVAGSQDINGLTFEEGTVTLSGGTELRLVSDAQVYVAANRIVTIATPLTEDATPRQLTKAGPGTLVLSGNNSYSSNTVLSAGVLSIPADNVLGLGQLVLSGGTIQSSDATARSLNNPLVLNGSSVIGGAANFNFNSTGAGSVTAASTISVTNANVTATIASALGGTGSFTKAGSGTVTLTGNNTYSGATTVSAGTLIVNGGMITNTAGSVNVSAASGTLIVTNGGTMFTGSGSTIGAIKIIGGGSGGPTSTWNLSSKTLTIANGTSSGTLIVDGCNGEGSAAITNVSTLYVGYVGGSSGNMVLTNGARVFSGSVWLGYPIYPNNSENNKLTIVGGAGVNSILNAGGGTVNVGYQPNRVSPNNNMLTIDAGGILTNASAMLVGWAANRQYNGISGNRLVVTNGGLLFTTGNSFVGEDLGGGAFSGVINNSAIVSGVNSANGVKSLWNLGGANLTVGYGIGNQPTTNNLLAVNASGVVTNINVLSIKATNTLSLGVGGQIYANAATNAGTFAVAIDGSATPTCGRLTVADNLNVNNATLNVTAGATATEPCVIASYGSLTGAFAVTNGLPDKYRLDMSYKGNQIAIVYTAAGTIIQFK